MPVILSSIDGDQGSCCQNGDVDVAPCKGWWYQCTTYGIRDFKAWLKFGEHGLTMPPVTEHKATCEYYPERRQCPMPANCDSAVPKIAENRKALTYDEVCDEIQNMVYLGPKKSSTTGVAAPSSGFNVTLLDGSLTRSRSIRKKYRRGRGKNSEEGEQLRKKFVIDTDRVTVQE